jgi:hypothetical protein
MMDDNCIDKSFSCRGGVLEYERRMDEDMEGPVKKTMGPVRSNVLVLYILL